MIEAISIYGNKVNIPEEKFELRVSAYGIIIHDGKVLVVNVRSSDKLFFPGGGVEIGEKVDQALIREVKEETGIDIEIKKFLELKETFFYYDPLDKAYQNYSLIYACRAKNTDLTNKFQADPHDEAEESAWIAIEELSSSDFQPPADEVFRLIHP